MRNSWGVGGAGLAQNWSGTTVAQGGGGPNPMHHYGTVWNSTGVDPEQFSVFCELPRTVHSRMLLVTTQFFSQEVSLLDPCFPFASMSQNIIRCT